MKRLISLLIASILLTISLSSCSRVNNATEKTDFGFSIVTTIFPTYDWVINILGDNPSNIEVTMPLNNGVDLHSYQPTADDILKISSCDLFIYVGGESDEWIEDALKEATNKNMVVVNLIDALGDKVKEEEIVPGMEAEDERTEDGEEEIEYDEHIWLSLNNASYLTGVISDAICSIDETNATVYEDNAATYIEKLDALDCEYRDAVDSAKLNTLLFGDRFPFRYMVDDYGLSYYAAFVGCSAETEASFETITFLAQKVDELSLHTVLTIDGSDHRIAETIISNTKSRDQRILSLDSMQSTTSKDVKSGITYLGIMEDNLAVLKEALK